MLKWVRDLAGLDGSIGKHCFRITITLSVDFTIFYRKFSIWNI